MFSRGYARSAGWLPSGCSREDRERTLEKDFRNGPCCSGYSSSSCRLPAARVLRFVQTADEAKNFHPKSIGVLPAEVGIYKDAEGKIDGIITEVLVKTKWFNTVIGGEEIRKRIETNEELKKSVDVYLAKLRELNYSDPELCKVISELCGIEAILIPTVDTWEYTMLSGDKIARVGLSLKLIDTRTGKTMWRAGHLVTEEYRFLRPELTGMALSMVRKMIDRMPH